MLGPEAWYSRQKQRKEEEKRAAKEAAERWRRPNYGGGLKSRGETHKTTEAAAEKAAKEGLRRPAFRGGWERRSIYHPFIRNKEKEKAATAASEERLHRSRFTGNERKSLFRPSARHKENDRVATEAAKTALRKPTYGGGWERRSLFHPLLKQKERERKAREEAKALHARPLFAGMDRQTAIARQRSGGAQKIIRRISHRVSKRIFGGAAKAKASEEAATDAESASTSSSRPSSEGSPDSVDVCIVGGGFGGAYAAFQLSKTFPHLRVLVVEKQDSPGGRLLSGDNDSDNTTNKDELGGMRLFPSHHQKVAGIVAEVGCSLVPVRLEDDTNLFLRDGRRVRKREFHVEGRSPRQMLADCREAFAMAHPDDAACDPLESDELTSLCLADFLKKYGASEEEVEAFFCYSGYDIFSDPEVQAALFIKEGDLYDSELDSEQKYVQQGYQEVVRRMLLRSDATVLYGATVVGIDDSGAGARTVRFEGADGEERTVTAGHVIVSLPQDALAELLPSISCFGETRATIVRDAVKTIPLFKVFLEWDRQPGVQQWWKEAGFECGKSTTDLEIRQLHYYDNEDLLVYCSGEYADHWHEAFSEDPGAAARQVFEQIKQLHGDDDIPEPNWDATIFKYWPSGSHKWTVDHQAKALMPLISNGAMDRSRVHVVGDAFSTHQGWTMGCVETVDQCLSKLHSEFL